MKKRLTAILLTVFMALSFFAMSALAIPNTQNPNPRVTINKTTNPPKLDGVINSGEYGPKIHTTYDSPDQFDSEYNEAQDIRADFYACWDDKYLYLGWVVHTDHHFAPESSCNMWLYNSIQFNIADRDCSSKDSGTDFESFSIAVGTGSKAGKSMKCNQFQNNDAIKSSMWKFTGLRDDSANTTTYEVAYPWSTLDMTSEIYSTDVDNHGFHGNGGQATVGTVIGLGYAVMDTTSSHMHSDSKNGGFWEDGRSTQWGSGVIGLTQDCEDAKYGLPLLTLGPAIETGNTGSSGSQDGTQGSQGGTQGSQGGTQGTQGGTQGTQGGTQGTQGGTQGGSVANPGSGTVEVVDPVTGEVTIKSVDSISEDDVILKNADSSIADSVADSSFAEKDIKDISTNSDDSSSKNLTWLWIVLAVVVAAGIAVVVIFMVKNKNSSDEALADGENKDLNNDNTEDGNSEDDSEDGSDDSSEEDK